MEFQLRIEQRWVIRGPEYIQFKDEAALGKYCTVLNELEHLVVMRLFELSKLLLSGTGIMFHLVIFYCFHICFQDTNYVSKLEKHYSAVQRQSAMQSTGTILRLLHSTHHVQNCPGRTLESTASWENSTCCVIHAQTFGNSTG